MRGGHTVTYTATYTQTRWQKIQGWFFWNHLMCGSTWGRFKAWLDTICQPFNPPRWDHIPWQKIDTTIPVDGVSMRITGRFRTDNDALHPVTPRINVRPKPRPNPIRFYNPENIHYD